MFLVPVPRLSTHALEKPVFLYPTWLPSSGTGAQGAPEVSGLVSELEIPTAVCVRCCQGAPLLRCHKCWVPLRSLSLTQGTVPNSLPTLYLLEQSAPLHVDFLHAQINLARRVMERSALCMFVCLCEIHLSEVGDCVWSLQFLQGHCLLTLF